MANPFDKGKKKPGRPPNKPTSNSRPSHSASKELPSDPYDYEQIFIEAAKPQPPLLDRIGKKRIKRTGIIVSVVLLLLISVSYVRGQFDPSGKLGTEISIQIPKGASQKQIAKTLDEKGVIPSATAFQIWMKIDSGGALQAGEYNFRLNSSTGQALAVLQKGPKVRTDKLTIPEGRRLAQIAELVGKLPGMSAQKFLELANNGSVRSEYQSANSKSLEGYLFPDTYNIGESDNEETLLKRMVAQFGVKARLAGLPNSERSIMQNVPNAVIIASLIEAEAKTDEDRGKISQVIENRLTKEMPLQIDATVLYALGNTKSSLSNADLKVDSVFNTYKHSGLPPRPICNPGQKSLEAALNPTPGNWLYYVIADENGGHAFANTFDEHQKNIKAAQAKGLL